MSHSVRFLALAIAAWAGVRAVAFSFDPGHDALAATFTGDGPAGAVPAPTATAPTVPPGMAQSPATYAGGTYGAYPPPMPGYAPYGWMPVPPPGTAVPAAPPPVVVKLVAPPSPPPVPYAAPPALGALSAYALDWPGAGRDDGPVHYLPIGLPPLDAKAPPQAVTPPLKGTTASLARRLRATGWAFYRDEGAARVPGIAPAGQLAGSQVGARALYRLSNGLDASVRYTGAVGTLRGSEAALGLRAQPFGAWPLSFTLERRERIEGVGRSAFSLFGEMGAYGVTLPAGLAGEGYVQAGLVGLHSRDWFLDTQLAVTRPLWRGVALGGGIWTSAQPGLARADIGPRLSLPAPGGARLHADYRIRVAGNAAPGSGAALTLAKDF